MATLIIKGISNKHARKLANNYYFACLSINGNEDIFIKHVKDEHKITVTRDGIL